jgi:hypothetical protein
VGVGVAVVVGSGAMDGHGAIPQYTGVAVAVAVGVHGASDGVAVAVGVHGTRRGSGVGVAVAVGVQGGVGVAVAVGVQGGVGVAVAVGVQGTARVDGELLGDGVNDGDVLLDGPDVGVYDGDGDDDVVVERERDTVGVPVGDPVGDGDGLTDGEVVTDGDAENDLDGDGVAEGVGQFCACAMMSSPIGPSSWLPMFALKAMHAIVWSHDSPSAAGRPENGWMINSRWGYSSVGPAGPLNTSTVTVLIVAPNARCASVGPYRAARMVDRFSWPGSVPAGTPMTTASLLFNGMTAWFRPKDTTKTANSPKSNRSSSTPPCDSSSALVLPASPSQSASPVMHGPVLMPVEDREMQPVFWAGKEHIMR